MIISVTKLHFRQILFRFALLLILSLWATSAVQATEFFANDDLIGTITSYAVQPNDNLYKIAQQHDVGIVKLLAANPGIDPLKLKVGKILTLPTAHILPDAPRDGIVINLAELRLFYFADIDHVFSFPIGVGKEGSQTPQGTTTVIRKKQNPIWTPPASIRAENPELPEQVLPGPDNPLGNFALYLGWPSYLIHGTNVPNSVGKRTSHGCIRLFPEDIEALFGLIEDGTEVTVVNQPYKLGWQGDTLYLEIAPIQPIDLITGNLHFVQDNNQMIYTAIASAATFTTEINWDVVANAIQHGSGLPVAIGTKQYSNANLN